MRPGPLHVLLVLAAVTAATTWWTLGPRPAAVPPSVRAAGCPLPPRPAASPAQAPLQGRAPAGLALAHPHGRVQALAGFSLQARVLAARAYRQDPEARFAPLDLALGGAR